MTFVIIIIIIIITFVFFYKSPIRKFYDNDIFPILNTIDYSIIKKEFIENELSNNSSLWQEWPETYLWKSSNNASWKVIPLMAFSKWSESNIKKYNKTYKELSKIKGLITAGFSKLGPDTSLEFHKGWAPLSNNVLRCHLGIRVPDGRCRIIVKDGDIEYRYQKGDQWLIFDDSLEHSADNNSTEDRVVLILDIERPPHIKKGTSNVEFSPELESFLNEFNKSI